MADANTAKRLRATAKGSFTRISNKLLDKIQRNEDSLDVLELMYKNAEAKWNNLIEKNEQYITALTEEDEDADAWLTNVEESYETLQIEFATWKKRNKSVEIETSRIRCYKLKEKEVNDCFKNIHDLIKNESMSETIKRERDNLTFCFRSLKDNFMKILENSENEEYSKKFNLISTEVRKTEIRVDEYICKLNTNKDNRNRVRMEKLPLPTFDGSIRDYPRFKKEFMELVMPDLSNEEAAFSLRRCLTKDVESTLGACNEEITVMLKRLDEKYGDPRKLVDAVVTEINQHRKIKDFEKKTLVTFVDMLERAYLDLKKSKLEKEMSCTNIISIIENKLPENVSMDWYRHIYKNAIDKHNSFVPLLDFLKGERSALEYSMSRMKINKTFNDEKIWDKDSKTHNKCWIHPDADSHTIDECFVFNAKQDNEKLSLIKENGVCWICLQQGHRAKNCFSKKVCGESGCGLYHHKSLHHAHVTGMTFHTDNPKGNSCLLLLMKIKTLNDESLNVMWDSASTISLITFAKAKELSLTGTTVDLTITKAGGVEEEIRSCRYQVVLKDASDIPVTITLYGLPTITSSIAPIEIKKTTTLFNSINCHDICRPSGNVDILIGLDYASFHPQIIENLNHLALYQNRFGKCIGGTHPDVQENTKRFICQAEINHINAENIKTFFDYESIGIECNPKCGNCRCGKCPLGGKQYNIKEERELKMIEDGLVFKGSFFEVKYPWRRDPDELPNNKSMAFALLIATEKRLSKNELLSQLYVAEINDMINRKAARKLTKSEISNYQGPIHYLTHHEVLKMDHPTTPCRIVFNASKNYEGHVLNDYWAKGPDLLNNMLGVILRFREEHVCITGDVKKMYHSVKISSLDQHTHRFLWRDMITSSPPDTYVMTCVSFGDKPAGTIAQLALRKTAEMSQEQYPEVCKTIAENTYMDDILDSVLNKERAVKLTNDISKVLSKGGFQIKSWTISGEHIETIRKEILNEDTISKIPLNKTVPLENSELFSHKESIETASQKVLGIRWDLNEDQIKFSANLNFSSKIMKAKVEAKLKILDDPGAVPSFLTKRMILSQINGIFDPLGLAAPFIVKGKILMRRLWVGEFKSLSWDDPIPAEEVKKWTLFFEELLLMKDIKFKRCLRPKNAKNKMPTLVMFSDASEAALGCCAYVRWELDNGEYECRLIAAKNKVTPIKEMSIVRKELEAAVISKRLTMFICQEMRYEFENIYFLVDSEIVLAMINKENYGFNTYAALRIGEIQRATKPEQWAWVDGRMNIADWVTRGCCPTEIQYDSIWQLGPPFLRLPMREWPIRQKPMVLNIPEQIRTILAIQFQKPPATISNAILIDRFSKYLTLLGTTARVLAIFRKRESSLLNCKQDVLTSDYEAAKMKWVYDCQVGFTDDYVKRNYLRLSPQKREDGIWVVGSRTEKWLEFSYNKANVVLLPFNHRFSKLFAEFIHSISHLGVLATVAKIRLQFWIVNLPKMVKSIIFHCVTCRKRRKETLEQIMSPLPLCRLQPAPVWYAISLDYCGPFTIRGEVNKRSRGKCYMILMNCLVSRAVYVDVTSSYNTDEFMKLIRRFYALKGQPSIIYADNGSQIRSASKEMSNILKGLDWKLVSSYGAEKGTMWNFNAPDAPWQNGCSEALIKSLKKCLSLSIGDHILSFTEIQTVAFEAANVLNERPIGRHPTSPDEGHYLCPNDLILGRATSRVPQGPFKEYTNDKQRFNLVQAIVDMFWKKMVRSYFPNLLIHPKWHTQRRNVSVGDIVLIQDTNAVRGDWKLGRVSKVDVSNDGLVRNCYIQYKLTNPDFEERKRFTTVKRPVQKLVIILPVEEDKTK